MFQDLQEHLEELFSTNAHDLYMDAMLRLDALRAARRREEYIHARNGRAERLKPGPAKWQTPEGRRERHRAHQAAKRATARGDTPRKSWRLTDAQKEWARTNGLLARLTAEALGVSTKAVYALRKKALDAATPGRATVEA